MNPAPTNPDGAPLLPRILMVSAEASPWAKSGGLADVLGSLPAALAALGHRVAVVLPNYASIRGAPATPVYDSLPVYLGDRVYNVSIRAMKAEGVTIFLVHQPELFGRPGLYGDRSGDYPDNHIRFAVLSKASLEISRRLFPADVYHCHDWQAALVPVFLNQIADPYFLGARTLLTIHNLGYQGLFEPAAMRDLGLQAGLFSPAGIEFWGKVNLLKGGIVFADCVNTVSRKYADEIQTPEYGFGLDGLLATRSSDLKGILNGVDYTRWNPETDPFIPSQFSALNLAGKSVCKRRMIEERGFPRRAAGRPLLGIVSRFVSQKGFDLLEEVAPAIFSDTTGLDVSLVALGSGEPRWENFFRDLQAKYPARVSLTLGYDEALSHRIEAASDVFLMPSRYEPCGLNQIYSLRYGTVPVVRATGGLDDTVTDAPPGAATGFKFHDYNGKALLGALTRACRLWADPNAWSAMMVRGMHQDFSWTASAGDYSRLYARLASFG